MQYCLIDSAIGTMGLGWTEAGVARFALPAAERAQTERRIASGGAAPGEADRGLVEAILAYADGEWVEFADTPLDLDGVPDFYRSVYADILGLGWGETTTYGEIAKRLGDQQLSRAVGEALGRNPIPLIIPCHRVLAAGGGTGGFSAPGGVASKLRMLTLEGVRVGPPEPAQMTFQF
jgi:methylated-DNA-[protein]-cysteine S-methyltransferase